MSASLVIGLGAGTGVAVADEINVPGDYLTIQDAINTASDGDTIVVQAGTDEVPEVYDETINFEGKAIHLTTTDPTKPAATVIDGFGRDSSVVTCISGEGPDTILEGFTITGGTGSVVNITDEPTIGGGGMLNIESNPTVENCVFEFNAVADFGGGMLNQKAAPTVTNCTFFGNEAGKSGGGMLNVESSPTVEDCLFELNHADTNGGGMLNSRSDVVVRGSVFRENIAENFNGGGMGSFSESKIVIEDSVFDANDAYRGAGMYSWESTLEVRDSVFRKNIGVQTGGLSVLGYSSAEVINCTFEGNSSGGMVVASGGVADVVQCVFVENVGETYGGGLRFYSASGREHADRWSVVENCTFAGNHAGSGGGGVYIFSSPVEIRNTGESPTEDLPSGFLWNTSYEGGGLYVNTDNVIIDGVLFFENDAEDSGGGIFNHGDPMITSSRFEGNSAGWRGGGIRSVRGGRPEIEWTEFCENTPDHISGQWDDEGGNTFADTCGPVAEPEPPGALEGFVTDANTGDGIEGATVTIVQTDQAAMTDGGGAYAIEDVEAGTYDVTASASGYEPETLTTTVDSDQTTSLDFALTPDESEPGELSIDIFELIDNSNRQWARVTIDWAVSGNELDRVELEVVFANGEQDDAVISVSGSDAAGQHQFRARGAHGEASVTLRVLDQNGNDETAGPKSIDLGG